MFSEAGVKQAISFLLLPCSQLHDLCNDRSLGKQNEAISFRHSCCTEPGCELPGCHERAGGHVVPGNVSVLDVGALPTPY